LIGKGLNLHNHRNYHRARTKNVPSRNDCTQEDSLPCRRLACDKDRVALLCPTCKFVESVVFHLKEYLLAPIRHEQVSLMGHLFQQCFDMSSPMSEEYLRNLCHTDPEGCFLAWVDEVPVRFPHRLMKRSPLKFVSGRTRSLRGWTSPKTSYCFFTPIQTAFYSIWRARNHAGSSRSTKPFGGNLVCH
jgi:hypothetical protein